ncbi:cation diffusion zinc membrane transporter Zrg17 [Coniosporium tulheliwenetii]|uniref:Cation diffusion zinc membrane transporter Zrg17 n=1 Tax=Coniosporium tulheliwenetii TaxID=3383036 RepID=A0ACC2ZQ91_9PEZI|nr:cation diffusion zinc membrane transporter Zrg17 [Cladosporium sp. JES 115]
MPLPIPPRTPTPPPDDEDQPVGLGVAGAPHSYNPDALSPTSATFPSRGFGSLADPTPPLSARSPLSSAGLESPYGSLSDAVDSATPASGSENGRNPFNFQTQQYTLGGKSPAKSVCPSIIKSSPTVASSYINHQHFPVPRCSHRPPPRPQIQTQQHLSPNLPRATPRPPLQLPASLPIPTFKEFRHSMTADQKYRALWCFGHLLVAGYVQASAHGSMAMTALSHLLFYDTIGAFVCVAVDVGGNFEVWKRSTIKHPFGLQRAEVLAGMAMAVTLLFMGLDLLSHGLQHSLENVGGHESHHPDSDTHHERISPGEVDIAALAAIVSTLVSALLLKNHARMGKVLRLAPIAALPSVLSNPSHFLTLSCSALLLLLPLLSVQSYVWLDRLLAFSIAACMVGLGWRLGWTLGKMLMMSYSSPSSSASGVEAVLAELRADPAVAELEEAKFWQVNYGLCQANLRVRCRGAGDEEAGRLRERIASLVRNRLGGAYGGGLGVRWEVSTQLSLERE